jgi:hypothetical protein
MARRKKKFPFGCDAQTAHDYFVSLANEWGRPFGSQRKQVSVQNIPRGAFISHSYSDQSNLQRLLALLPPDFGPTIQQPISVLPTEFVSTPLIEAVRAASALIYFGEGPAQHSRWVNIEVDTARRAGKLVFIFYPSTGEFKEDHGRPKSLWVHGVYALSDRPVAEALIDWMAVNRNFKVEDFSPFEWPDVGERAAAIMDFSGIFLAFTGKNTLRELPMGHIRLACEQEDEWTTRRLIIACLDPPDSWIPESVRKYLIEDGVIDLTDGGDTRPWSANRLDDLIVRILWRS